MLKSLQIKNYVLIRDLDISFRPGFSVLTGQTGAGKSIILGAIDMLMGQRAEGRAIAEGEDKCSVEGHFDITGYGMRDLFDENGLDYDEVDTIFRREVMRSGKSRAFINDTPVSLATLRSIGSHLIDIHSQHQNLLLGTESFQTGILDSIAGNEGLLAEYRDAYSRYRQCISTLEKLRQEYEESRREQDYLQFQSDEIDKAALTDGEQQELEEEQSMLSHAEDIRTALIEAMDSLSGDAAGATDSLRRALQAMRQAARNLPSAESLAERLESCLIEIRDIDSEASRLEDQASVNPERLEEVTERLDLIYSLERKHHCDTVGELIGYAGSLKDKLDRLESCQDETAELEKQSEALLKEVKRLAGQLSESRRKAARTAGASVVQMLVPLGIPNARFEIETAVKDSFDMSGADSVHFLFSANQGSQMQELSAIASGGELSRVMLAVKYLLAGTCDLPTIIFDEIDTGVSGAIAEKMALMMRGMCAEGRQVIAISHLPQIAAKSDTHYLVYKEEGEESTHTYITELDKEQRITETARMMSGATITDAAMDNARALIYN